MEYPKINDDIVIILDDYSNAATGKELKLDFHDIPVESLKQEAKECIIRKYQKKAASPTYLRVLIPAVKRFAKFAKEKGISSFSQYTDEVAKEYLEYLNHSDAGYSIKYIRYLWSVPAMMHNEGNKHDEIDR